MSDNTAVLSCVHCELQLRDTDCIAEKGELFVYRCRNCGNETTIQAIPAIPEALQGRCVVRIEWGGEIPSVSELSSLRKLIPRFREYPITKIREMVGVQHVLDLGDYAKGDALDMQREGKELGLRVIITNPA